MARDFEHNAAVPGSFLNDQRVADRRSLRLEVRIHNRPDDFCDSSVHKNILST
jgi:hypothetical protein